MGYSQEEMMIKDKARLNCQDKHNQARWETKAHMVIERLILISYLKLTVRQWNRLVTIQVMDSDS